MSAFQSLIKNALLPSNRGLQYFHHTFSSFKSLPARGFFAPKGFLAVSVSQKTLRKNTRPAGAFYPSHVRRDVREPWPKPAPVLHARKQKPSNSLGTTRWVIDRRILSISSEKRCLQKARPPAGLSAFSRALMRTCALIE